MLFRLVQPMNRKGTRNYQFVRRIPADLRERMVGMKLDMPLGDDTVPVAIGPSTDAIRYSLRTSEPEEVKARTAAAIEYLERLFRSLRANTPITLTHSQAVALSREIYEAWSIDPDLSLDRAIAIELGEDDDWQSAETDLTEIGEGLSAMRQRLINALEDDDMEAVEASLGPLVDRVLMSKGIVAITAQSRVLILREFHRALEQGIAVQARKATHGDYSPDPNASRFPAWQAPELATQKTKVSLTGLVEEWWKEAERTGRSQSTHEGYARVFANLSRFLKHDDATRVSEADIIGFKDWRLSQTSAKTGKPISARTVKDSDLSALRSVFQWAVDNRKLLSNPATGIRIAKPRSRKLRDKHFTHEEAGAILKASLETERRPKEPLQQWATRRWVPWVCAYSGARVGEIIQLRRSDLLKLEGHWVIRITPEAVTVKDDEARYVPLHPHLIELGFPEFVTSCPDGPLFMWTGMGRPAWRTSKNRLTKFVREHVTDPLVQPNHAWRYTFKTLGLQAGIEGRVLDDICGHEKRTVGERYSIATIATMASAMKKYPRYSLDGPDEVWPV